MNALVEEALNLAYHGMRAQDSAFNIAIDKQLAAGCRGSRWSPQDISRVLVNILTNAFYATEEKKKAEKRETSRGLPAEDARGDAATGRRAWKSSSKTTAPAFRPRSRRKIFDPFFTTKPAGAGTGSGALDQL